MEKVKFLGGAFIYSDDPKSLAAWYKKYLGIDTTAHETFYSHDFLYRYHDDSRHVGRIVWAIIKRKENTSPLQTGYMLNYRVDNLDKMLAQLRALGLTIEKIEDHPNGRFAWLTDPEGNRIELFEDFEY